jgi:hypothetical protein
MTTYSPEEVADRMAINDLITRYVHALDDREYDVLDTVFLPDTIFDLTSAGAIRGTWPTVKELYKSQRTIYVHYLHVYGNVRIDFDSDRRSAQVKSKVINPIGVPDETGKVRLFQVHGAYDDVFVKTDDGWRIKERKWQHGWISGDYPFDKPPGALTEHERSTT